MTCNAMTNEAMRVGIVCSGGDVLGVPHHPQHEPARDLSEAPSPLKLKRRSACSGCMGGYGFEKASARSQQFHPAYICKHIRDQIDLLY